MTPLEGGIEIAGLFAVAAMIAWPALRQFLPARQTTSAAASSAALSAQRFVPKSAEAAKVPEIVDEIIGHLNGTGIGGGGDYEDEEEDDDGLPESGVLPFAEALLRGERVSVKTAAKPPARSATDLFPPVTTNNGVEPPAAAREMRTVLLAESREKVRTALLLKLARSGYRVFPVAGGREALDLFSRQQTDVVYLDFDILKRAGADLVRRIRALAPFVPILVPGARSSAEQLEIDVTMIPHAGENPELLAEMVQCALAASKCIERVRADQDVRSRILADLCYNLRSSLEIIHGYTDILNDEADLGRYRDLLERVRASTEAASAQMQTYVDLSFLEVPNEEVRHDRVDLTTLEERIEHLVSRQIGDRPLRLSTSGPLQGSMLLTDGDRLLAILAHIVTDAVRFTPNGEINIAVRAMPERTDFIVSDPGPGISADVPMPLTAPENGGESGIGLAIAERLSRSIGASLTGACGEGGAASFTLSVPSKLVGPTTYQNGGLTLH